MVVGTCELIVELMSGATAHVYASPGVHCRCYIKVAMRWRGSWILLMCMQAFDVQSSCYCMCSGSEEERLLNMWMYVHTYVLSGYWHLRT